MYKLSEEVKMCLRSEGIQDDDIQELEETGTMLIDVIKARDASWELIEQGIPFKCEPSIDELFRITLL